MKKRIVIFTLIVVLLLGFTSLAAEPTAFVWDNFRGSAVNMAITSAPTPTDPAKTEEKWSTEESLQQGSGWNVNNPAPALLVGGKLITTSGNQLVELDTATGAVLRTAEMEGVCGTLGNSAPAYGGGMIFMPLQDGRVQAFDSATLRALWISESLGKQCTTGLIYDGGYVFGCTGNSSPGKVFCLKAEDEMPDVCQEQEAVWAIYDERDDKGAYWSTPLVTESAVVYGTDSGFLISRSRTDGEERSRLTLTGGKQRSGISFANGRVYGGTSSGYLFSAALEEDGTLSDLLSYKDAAVSSITSTPVVYDGVVYYGGSKQMIAADAATLETLRTTGETGFEQPRFGGAVQSSFLLRAGEDCVWLYATQNCNPGGLYLVKDTDEEMVASVLHTPAEGKQNYCLVSPVCDENGVIYYRNDSGFFFAVGTEEEKLATVRFSLTPAEATLAVAEKSGTAAEPVERNTYRLAAGDYVYRVEHDTRVVEGVFAITEEDAAAEAEKTIQVSVPAPTFATVRFSLTPAEATLAVAEKSGTAAEPVERNTYRLAAGDYVYRVEHDTRVVEGVFAVTEEEAAAEAEKTIYVTVPTPPRPSEPAGLRVYVKVSGYDGATLFRKTAFVLPAGSTVYDLLLETGLAVDTVTTEYGVYVRAIAGLAEKAMGEGSGWIYKVNGESPMFGASALEIQAGDYVLWEYVAPNAPQEEVSPAPAAPKQETVLPYADTQNHWGKAAITFVTERSLMNGVTAERFAPNEPLTRSMLAVILHRHAGAPKNVTTPFADVAADAWYAQGIAWAAEKNIVQGFGDDRFLPNGNITREQLAVMLYRYAGAVGGKITLSSFRDADAVSDWAKEAVCWAFDAGILTGRDDGTICPQEQATRAEAATMLMRFVQWKENR